MSPEPKWVELYFTSFPRVSGDEPAVMSAVTVWSEFSPRERG